MLERKNVRKRLSVFMIAVSLLLGGQTVSAQFKDGDNIKIIVPFSPGGGYDRVNRLLAPFFEEELRKLSGADVSVVITNITGAGGVNGYSRMFRAKPDGKTLGMVGLAAAPYQQLMTGLFDLDKFTYIAQVNTDPTVLTVRADSPLNSVDDLIERSHEKPILMGTSGKGAAENVDVLMTQAVLEKYGKKLNVDFVHYQGSAPAVLGLIKGETEAMTGSESSIYPLVKKGELKGLGIYSKQRGSLVKDVPTLTEQQVPGAEELSDIIGMVRVIIAPPGIPEPTADLLRKAMANALKNPEAIAMAEKVGLAFDSDTAQVAQRLGKQRLETAKKHEAMIKAAFE